MPDADLDVIIVGATAAGMAAAARLAKAGHRVGLVTEGRPPGGVWAARPLAGSPGPALVDDAPAVITLPAAWRDLFRKSGRPMDAELARAGWELVPAPPPIHRFPDGTELTLPTDRGEQFATLSTAYGSTVAAAWRDLIDDLDQVWQALRPLGLESELHGRFQLTRSIESIMKRGRSLERLAREFAHPALAAIITDLAYPLGSDPTSTPAHCAVELSMLRRFGRWTVRRTDGAEAGRTSALIEILTGRLATRKVIMIDDPVAEIMIDTAGRASGVITAAGPVRARSVIGAVDPPRLYDELLGRLPLRPQRATLARLRPALAPTVTARAVTGERSSEVRELIEHRPGTGPLITVRRPAAETMIEIRYDYAATRPDWRHGLAWQGYDSWLLRPPIRGPVPGLYVAGPFSAAGPGLSQTLLSGALASYACHDDLLTSSVS
ncbi:FAD-dependent oxidoreductase [Microlunatus speluncae]|uniref:FAD-dependent oxidoreductase n=1 Tax=Microlunatus speluncae TaxID=2594267 RepID=UPI0012666F24|nr:FAD-dependent oxidoreductase [Microlunatus speluncae]